jgi:predicted GIY-YIG superfamily endonuclease
MDDWQTGEAPVQAGVYMFSLDREVWYVGQSRNLRSRIASHMGDPWMRALKLLSWTEFDVQWQVTPVRARWERERLLLEQYKPVLNVAPGRRDMRGPYVAPERPKRREYTPWERDEEGRRTRAAEQRRAIDARLSLHSGPGPVKRVPGEED